MSLDTLTHLILTYRYWVLVPLSLLDGPIVALVAGTLASLGYFNIFLLALFFFVRDMIMDGGYYALGHFGGRTAWARRLLARIGVTDEHLESVRNLWKKYPGRTMLIGKLSYGITASFIVVAGIVRMPLVKFFGWGAVVAVAQYIVLLTTGFFFGAAFGSRLSVVVQNLQYAIAGASLLILGYVILSWRMRRNFLKKASGEQEKNN